MPSPSNLLLNFLELDPQTVAAGLPFDQEFTAAACAANEGEAEKAEGLRFSEPTLSTLDRREAAKMNQADHASIIDPMLQEAYQPFLTDRIKEASEVRVENIVHLRAVDSGDQCIQRIVRAALRPEPIRETNKLFLVDRVQHRAHRPLDD